jgi:hypothetical protein
VVQNSDNAANRRNHGYQIFVMDADGGNVRLLANTEERATAVRRRRTGRRSISQTACRKSGLRDINGAIRAAAAEGKLSRAPGCFLIASCGFVPKRGRGMHHLLRAN